jgi:hypothetical protein
MSLTRDELEAVTAPFLASDLALEVRSVYDERLTAGEGPGPATAAVFESFRNLLGDPDEGPVIFLAVAAIQLREGQLLDPIRDAALSLIDSGDAQRAWRPSTHDVLRDRRVALAQLAELLRPEKD